MSVGGLAAETLAEAVRYASTWLEINSLSTNRCRNTVAAWSFARWTSFASLLVCYGTLAAGLRVRAVAAAACLYECPWHSSGPV